MREKEIQFRAMRWLASDDTGLSSKAILRHMSSIDGEVDNYPRDPSDLGRCLRLLDLIPEWKQRMPEMASLSPGWAGLLSDWDSLVKTMIDEVGIDWSKGDRAPKTYKMMRRLIDAGYLADDRYECSQREDGSVYFWRKIK